MADCPGHRNIATDSAAPLLQGALSVSNRPQGHGAKFHAVTADVESVMTAAARTKEQNAAFALDNSAAAALKRKRERECVRSSRRRKRDAAGVRVYRNPQMELLVVCALMVKYPNRTDLANHEVCEELLAKLNTEHLQTIIDCADGELRVDIKRMLRDFDR